MNPKHTLTWLAVALALFAFIVAWRFFQRPAAALPSGVLPGLQPAAVTSIQLSPNNAPEISVVRTNGNWVMTEPVVYPAQKTSIDALLGALQKLKPAIVISPSDLSQSHNPNSEYGFNSPQLSLAVQSGDERSEILVGSKTAPGDQVFVRVVGREGVFVTDTAWLKLIPGSPDDWRDSSLAGLEDGCDSIIITNGAKVIELHCDPTNHLWQMTRPLPSRANGNYITSALQQLQAARVSQFVTDNSNADLSAFGLQPANLNLWLGRGSNCMAALDLGKSSTNDPSQLFARRDGWNTIVTTAKTPLAPWYGDFNAFRDPYLLELTAPVTGIEMIGPDTNHFVLQRQAANRWEIEGEKFPVDPDSVQSLIRALAALRVSQFVKNVVTPADLPAYGLTNPVRQIILSSASGDTNAVIAHLLFGQMGTNEVFVQRTDEDFIYGITPDDFSTVVTADGNVLDGRPWEFRDRRIWNFPENDVVQITVRQNGRMRQMNRTGPNKWSLAAGSQGIINPPAIEEAAHQLGILTAVAWISPNVTNPAIFGLKPGNLSVTVTLKNGQSMSLDFGAQNGNTALAAVTLDGRRWAFVFSPQIFESLIAPYLTIPSSAP